MSKPNSEEIIVALIFTIAIFLLLAAVILLFLFLYQRRKLQQREEMAMLQRQFAEQSLSAQLEIQEQTLHAISQEIHDNVGQILSLAKVQINIIRQSERLDEELLEDIGENIGKAMGDLRDLARSLNSDRIRSFSLHEALIEETERINKTGMIKAELSLEGEEREIEPGKRLLLFRIIQESIQNCIRHAGASLLTLSFHYGAEEIQVLIEDDGKGFDPEAALREGKGIGLGNIQTRVRLTRGQCAIRSGQGEGTTIILTIPYG